MNRGELLKPEWTGNPEITGGFLYETPIHMFDMMRFLFGEVESLHAIGSTHEYKEIDDFSVLLKFKAECTRRSRLLLMRAGCFRSSASKSFAIMRRS